MRKWTISITPKAQKDLSILDKKIAEQVLGKLSWLENNFTEIIPQRLSGDLKNYYKLRVGDYRIIYDFNVSNFIVHIFRIGHRSRVYNK